MKAWLPFLLLPPALLAALAIGDRPLPLSALLDGPEAPAGAVFILHQLRLPRALMAVLVGAALAAAGTIAQAAMRNPLAEPGLIGLNGGAALAVMVIVVGIPGLPAAWLPWAAFGGAMAMVAVIHALALRVGLRSQGIILIGIGCSALTGGLASFLAAFGEIAAVQRAMLWMAGSLQDSRWDKLGWLALWLLPGLGLAGLLARRLDLLGLEDTVVRGLGLPAGRARAGALALCALICGAAVAATGPVAFVGLMAPHIARRATGPVHARLLPAAAGTGALLLLLADTLGRSVIAPAQLPAGLVTALMGAPFFGWLMWRHRDD